MSKAIDHALDDFAENDGWDVAVCACGWLGPACPDTVTAANFWARHRDGGELLGPTPAGRGDPMTAPPPMFVLGRWPSDRFLCFWMHGRLWVTDSHMAWRADLLAGHASLHARPSDDETTVCVWCPNPPEDIFEEGAGSISPMGQWNDAHPSEKFVEHLSLDGSPVTPHPWVWPHGVHGLGTAVWSSESWTTGLDGRVTTWLFESGWAGRFRFDQAKPLAPVRMFDGDDPVGLLMPQLLSEDLPPFPELTVDAGLA